MIIKVRHNIGQILIVAVQMELQVTFLLAERKVLDIIKGTSEEESVVQQKIHWIFIAKIYLSDIISIEMSSHLS